MKDLIYAVCSAAYSKPFYEIRGKWTASQDICSKTIGAALVWSQFVTNTLENIEVRTYWHTGKQERVLK